MKKLIVKHPKELELRHCERPCTALAGNEVKIKTEWGGIFLSDLGVYLDNIGHAVYPARAGYELICTIVEAGPSFKLSCGNPC